MSPNGSGKMVYWTRAHDDELERLRKEMKAAGMKTDHNGRANVSAILLFALLRTHVKSRSERKK